MVVTKNTRRGKKPIETTLGKAPDKPKKTENDISALQQPIETSIRGAKELAALLQTGTDEVKDLISYECELMYECKICRSIFRCLSNFVLHKRKYCLQKFNPACNVNHDETQILGPEARISVLDKIVERLRVAESESESLRWNVDNLGDEASRFSHIMLEKIDSNDSGMFQTFVNDTSFNKPNELTKTQVMENYKKLNNDVPVLDPEGKICGYTSNKLHNQALFPKCNVRCNKCNEKFATRKSLNNHVKTIHNPSKLLYFCPICKETLANPRCVYRHMLRVHNMPFTQVEKMRNQINNNCKVLRKDEDSIKIKKRPEPSRINNQSEHQWIVDMEVNKDFHMCVGCGTHFERKAALQGHLQMCTKKKEEKPEKAKSNKMPIEEKKITGALKRKRPTIYSCPRKRIILIENIDEEDSNSIEEKLDLLENNNVILNEVTVETAHDTGNNENEMQEVLTGSQNNNGSSLPEDGAEVPLSPEVIYMHELEQTDFDSPEHNEGNSNFSDESGSSRDDSEIIVLKDEDEVESEPDLLSDGVSFEMFYQQMEPTTNSLIEKLSEADNEVIFIEENEIIANEIVGEILNPMNLQQDDEKTDFSNEDIQLAEAINQEKLSNKMKNVQEIDDEQLNGTDRPSSNKTVQQVDSIKQNQEIIETGEPNIKPEQAHTKITEPGEDISNNEQMFPECALPFIVPLELLCIPCDRKFITKDELHCHMSSHFSWFRFECTKCSFLSFREEDCIIHAQERHSLEQDASLSCIVRIPYWKAKSISHSFKPLEDDDVVEGVYIDEEIQEEGIPEPIITDNVKSVVQESAPCFVDSSFLNDEDAEKKDTQLIEETIVVDQLLPEPIEMACPVDSSKVTSNNALYNEETGSSEDWGLPEVCAARGKTKKKRVKKPMPEPVPTVRAVRMRTKVQQDDFFYYDSNTSLIDFSRDTTVPTTSKKKREK